MPVPAQLKRAVGGKTVVVTGSSDGIGEHLARRLGAAGASVVLVARSGEKLQAVGDSIRSSGGRAHEYVANLAVEEDCERVVKEILEGHGHIDIFVSNAGRSIRRSVKYQAGGRFHDFERLMALNFFGALRLVLGLLPSMAERGSGQVVHVSSFGVPTRQPRFAGYSASKSALDAALQSCAGEVAAQGVRMSTVYMPLVRTKMVESKGHSYDHVPMLTLDMACELIEHAIMTRQSEVIDSASRLMALLHFFRPSLVVEFNSLIYALEGERAPDGICPLPEKRPPSSEKKRGAGRLLKTFGTVLGTAQQLDLVVLRCSTLAFVRDLALVVLFGIALLLQPILEAALRARRQQKGHRRQHASQTGHRGTPPPAESHDNAAPTDTELPYKHVALQIRKI